MNLRARARARARARLHEAFVGKVPGILRLSTWALCTRARARARAGARMLCSPGSFAKHSVISITL